jgi:hypothetical protein
MKVTVAHRQLIRIVLREKSAAGLEGHEQRAAIRELCAEVKPERGPEKILIAFKTALDEAADDARIPVGPDRNLMLSRIISVFIDELFKHQGSGVRAGEPGNVMRDSAPAFSLGGGSSETRL